MVINLLRRSKLFPLFQISRNLRVMGKAKREVRALRDRPLSQKKGCEIPVTLVEISAMRKFYCLT